MYVHHTAFGGPRPSGFDRSQRLWNCLAHRNLRYDRFLCPVRFHHNRLSLHVLPVYKSSTMVPFNLHHHFHSRTLRGRTLPNLYLLLILLPSYVLSSIRCRDALQVLHRFHIPPRFDILRHCRLCHHSCPRRQQPRSQQRSAAFRRRSLWHYKHFSKYRYFLRCSGRLNRTV
jgi:hypothetical protein